MRKIFFNLTGAVLLTSILGAGAFAAEPTRKIAQADARFNCGQVINEKKIKVCTDTGSIIQCRPNPTRLLQKGEKWADEFQIQAAEQTWVSDKEICSDYFTSVATKKACCGG